MIHMNQININVFLLHSKICPSKVCPSTKTARVLGDGVGETGETKRLVFVGVARPRAHRGTCASGPFPVKGSKAKIWEFPTTG